MYFPFSQIKFRFLNPFFLLIFCGGLEFCSEQKDQTGIAYDLTRLLALPGTKVEGKFPDKDPLPYHWKKNPGRHSGLPIERKWENTQITFNTDKTLFINHSLDALYLPPNSSYFFKIEKGDYDFKFSAGILGESINSSGLKGTLSLEVDGKEIQSFVFEDDNRENWKSIGLQISVHQNIKFIWKSENSHLYLAEPILYFQDHSKKPNVILIVLDSARKDFFGSYGFPYPITPNMDQLAKESVFFENPFSNGNWTKPSMISFFHSEYSSNLGLGNSWFTTKPYQRKVYYGKKRYNLTNILRENGYYTKTVMNNVFFLDYTTVGIDLGFHNSFQVGMDILDTPALTDHAVSFVDEIGQRPFFLHFNLNTPHASYSPPSEDMALVKKMIPPEVFYKFESPVQRYIGEMFYTDREVGRLLKTLKDKNLYDDSLIIVTGDHGELFSPHHDYSYHFIMKTRFGHGETHYDEEINVPYFIKPPRSVEAKIENRKISGQSSLLSLVPTVLGLLNLPFDPKQFRGVDYSSFIFGDSENPKEKTIYTEGRMSESLRTEEFKYIRRYPGFTTVRRKFDGEAHTMSEELYDLKKDPAEKTNLSQDTSRDSQALLSSAREIFQTGRFLNRNKIHLQLPPCGKSVCNDSGNLQVQGSIYDWIVPKDTLIQSTSAKQIQYQKNISGNSEELIFLTVNPELEADFRLYRDGLPVSYRVGRWGLEFVWATPRLLKELLTSEREPSGWDKSGLPWIYNDASFSGDSESTAQKEMGKEVKKILETWGYIHE
ncbi:sulfatase [Leptospira ilyithenensis]|uniref:Sulfatase n=1 Tax=Leptospira ilyithenensis TaxID=2484901 RepID=A0A4R9LMN1_9LEPT|nr:sulfatase [Leptospira ilyithenensis]TGN09822.1 sulfatase [Leptospira ilyithenensis]